MQALERAIEFAGSVSALASAIGCSGTAPHMWRKRGNVPAEYCPQIERATAGKVRCEDLRPDVDWAVLRNSAEPAEQGA